MTWQARILCPIYAAVALWLIIGTAVTWGEVPLWISITMTAVSLIPILAGRREAEHADDMRAVRVELERATRPAQPKPVISTEERARFDEITAGFNDKDQAA